MKTFSSIRWLVATVLVSFGCAASRQPVHVAASNPATPSIVGIVTDSASATPIDFCNVIVIGTRIGAQTDGGGIFKLMVPDTGVYQILVMHILYEKQLRRTSVVAGPADTVVFRLKKRTWPPGVVHEY